MSKENKKNKLSIYLIKDTYASSVESILKPGAQKIADVGTAGKVYFIPSTNTIPSWTNSFFLGKLGDARIFTSNAKVVLITTIVLSSGQTKVFALTMGYGKNMLADDVVVEDFGLKVVLNTISPKSLRRINKINIGGNQKASNEQLPLESDIDGFGFDIDRDLISAVTGKANIEDFLNCIITGSSVLNLTASVDINNFYDFLLRIYSFYVSDSYKEFFGWIDHIRKVRSHSLVDSLNAEIIDIINNGSPKVWMAVPEVIEWEQIEGFKYSGQETFDDVDISVLKEGLRTSLNNIEQLKNKRIVAVRADNGENYASWSSYKCLCGEIEYDGKMYCINNGNWYAVDTNFVESVNREYETVPIATMKFHPHSSEYTKENQYTQAFVKSDPNHLLCMDAKTIMHGGGQSKVELCDILTTDNTYIHIKPYTSSATLSHLFNQAVVSAELVMSDVEFRAKANLKIKELSSNEDFLINNDAKPNVVLAIISKSDSERPQIPFFSKIALRYAKRRLQTYGCNVSIKNIMQL